LTDSEIDKKAILGKLNDIFDDPLADDWEQDSGLHQQKKAFIQERFKDKELIATGGMKNIFKVFDTKTNRNIALAELREDVPEEQSELFLKEAYLTAVLEHPNIISIYDVGSDENHFPFFTMELKVGDSLEKILREKAANKSTYNEKYDLNKLLSIYIKVGDAVSYAHSQKILHLDIKPANIQVGQFGEVQLCDWGLGSNIETLNSGDDLIKGTPGYMPPEQFSIDKEKSFEADIYALGALLYAILSGETPSDGGLNTVITKTLSGDVLSPIERFPDKGIPESLNAVVCKAMSRDAEDRYRCVKDLCGEVESFLNGRSTKAENAGLWKETKLLFQRNKQISLVILIAILVLNIGGVIAFYKVNESKNKTEQAYEALQKSHEKVMLMTCRDASQKLVKPVFFTTHTLAYTEDAIQGFKTMIEATADVGAQKNLAIALIISQRFDDAIKYCDESMDDYLKVARKFKHYQKENGASLSDEELLDVLNFINQNQDINFRIKLAERMLVYHLAKNRKMLSPPALVKAVLMAWNPRWSGETLKYFKKDYTLRISGQGLSVFRVNSNFASMQCILRYLKIDRLDLSGSDFEDIRQLKGLDINYLDISKTKVRNLKHLPLLFKLERLVLSRNQTSSDELLKYNKIKIDFVD